MTTTKNTIKMIGVLLAFMLMMNPNANAQVQGGILAGGGFGYMTLEENNSSDFFRSKNQVNFEVGMFMKFQSQGLYFRPQVIYMEKTNEYSFGQTTQLKTLQFPLMMGIHLVGPLTIELGPTFNRILDSESTWYNGFRTYDNGFGYRVGPVMNFNNVALYTHFEGAMYRNDNGQQMTEPFRVNMGLAVSFGE